MLSRPTVALTLAFCVLQPPTASAQTGDLAGVLVRLIQTEIRLAGPPPGSPFPSHAAHFIPGSDQQLAPYLFNQAIVSQLSTFPVGSSSGSFSYTFDPSLGTYSRSTTSFGPSFAQRPFTLGRGRWNTGANYQHATYRSFEGRRLDTGAIEFFLPHLEETGAFFEGDAIRTALSMRLSTDTFTFFVNYGITDRLDVGVSVPIINVDLDATVDATILRLATLDTGPAAGIHSFPGGANSATFSDRGSATGIGDVLLRSKYFFLHHTRGQMAVSLDLRTPTGDENNLLGTGATQAKLLLIGSTTADRFSPHFNIGYTFSGNSSSPLINVTDEFNYAAGLEFTPSPRLTVAVDLAGRQLRGSGRLVQQAKVFNWTTQAGVTGSSTFTEFGPEAGSLNLTLGAVGFKFNPAANLLVSANMLFPLTDAGIRSRPVPVIGFDYTF